MNQLSKTTKELDLDVMLLTETKLQEGEVVQILGRKVEGKERENTMNRSGGVGIGARSALQMFDLDEDLLYEKDNKEDIDTEWHWRGLEVGEYKVAIGVVYIQGMADFRDRLYWKFKATDRRPPWSRLGYHTDGGFQWTYWTDYSRE